MLNSKALKLAPKSNADFASARVVAVFPKIDTLPLSHSQLAIDNGDGQANVGNSGLNMGRHIIFAFFDMFEPVGKGNSALHPLFEVMTSVGVMILLNAQTAGSMQNKKVAHTIFDVAVLYNIVNLLGDVIKPLGRARRRGMIRDYF